jgi:hypothetical protein
MWQLRMVSISITLILFASQLSVLMGSMLIYQPNDNQDPLTLFQAILPGTSITGLEDYPCRWYVDIDSENRSSDCNLKWNEGDFFLGNIRAYDLIITSMTLYADDLRVGDLPEYWGSPIIVDYGSFSYAHWYVADYQITVHLPRLHLVSCWSPIAYIIIRQRH